MGSTRFLKVARARTSEGLQVVKVFVKPVQDILFIVHQQKLEHIKTALQSAANCFPYQQFFITDKAAFIVREYIRHSLYDRISTRPFLTIVEKQWITFQLLYALHQCHKERICHGDIKVNTSYFKQPHLKKFNVAYSWRTYLLRLGTGFYYQILLLISQHF